MSLSDEDLCDIAADVLRSVRYLTLGTASRGGASWMTPLAHAWDHRDAFYWMSPADARHSRNIEENPAVSVLVFDLGATGADQALFGSGTARMLDDEETAQGCATYYERRYPDPAVRAQRSRPPDDFRGAAPNRLYRADIDAYSLLHPDGHPVHRGLVSHRVPVPFSTARLRGAR
ncbi:pyridoxamine 5'-phosphate oxidase family protein (plasmid) [Embleya sp. NBC_00888]|uniref:pyridoxamine 5'-phosphate oxidase family protein n=1 Tax=Embleya sp. NBC_00888 TaxID=2975960 RepID=UPI002F916C79|nr:pyridoxamine 5'-phosphate oxidase family protein [Embleya sp. NBC_00888]